MSENFSAERYPDEISEALCKLANTVGKEDDCKEALYHLKAIAENKYNNDYFRTLYRVLEAITDSYQCGDFDEVIEKGDEEKEVLNKWYKK